MNSITKRLIRPFLIFSALLVGFQSQAQGTTGYELSAMDSMAIIISLVLVVLVLILIVAMYLLYTIRLIMDQDAAKKAAADGKEVTAEPSAFNKFWSGLTDAVPIEKEESIDLHHEYDGIRELDNHLPPWWKWLFYITVVFAVVYMLAYHVFNTLPLQTEEYEIAMTTAQSAQQAKAADSPAASIDENNITVSEEAAVLASGKTVYERNCVACHKAAGEGGIGPNLTDEYWLHGGSVQDTYNSIKNGIPDKGMIAWKDVLSPAKMYDVNSYIYTLRGSNPANAKAAQGELYTENSPIASDSTATAN